MGLMSKACRTERMNKKRWLRMSGLKCFYSDQRRKYMTLLKRGEKRRLVVHITSKLIPFYLL